ncbi:restriction endonuclease [candidate division WOR-3 bacterium]|nr:restriction endonuclease [candidate division WOR-3 bacterium]
MNPAEYEELVSKIVKMLFKRARDRNPDRIRKGKRNKVQGVSGYRHQIDISLHGSSELVLIECKRWKSKVDVSAFLTFLGRYNDIVPTFNGSVNGMLVTTNGFQRGVYKLAEHYRSIELVEAKSVKDFVFRYGENLRRVIITPPPASASAGTKGPRVIIR